MKIKKIATCLALIPMLSLVSLTSCESDDNHITIAEVTHSLFYAPMYVAKNKGYFEDMGLKIDIITTPGADKTMASLLSKDAQIGLMGPEASVYVYERGQKDYAVNFAQLTQKDGSFLLGREKINNFSYDMLKGNTIIGGRKGGMPLMILEHILREKGIDFGEDDPSKEVNIRTDVSFDAMSGAFVAGESDYVTAFEPVASQVEQLNKGYIVASLGKDSGEIPYTCFSSLTSYMENNEETLKKFTKAISQGIHYVLTHETSEIIPYLKEDFPSSSEEELNSVMHNYLSIEAWSSSLKFKKESFDKLITIIKEAKELDSEVEVPYDTLVTNHYIED